MASNAFNLGINVNKVICEKSHKDLSLKLIQTTKNLWAILLFQNDELKQSRCYCWFSERIRKTVQLSAKRDFKKYKDMLMCDSLEYF